jgi:predicted DNA-binding transcriptional regulator YafY
MNRIDRLFAITVLLQTRPRLRARDLAAFFEVSQRTIYRDIEALKESGIPVVGEPGAGYELVEGFFLPALQFTPAEAQALFLAAEMLKSQASGVLLGSLESALAKIAHTLPGDTLLEASRLVEIVRFFIPPERRFNFDQPHLLSLQKAIQERRVVWMRYHSYRQDQLTERQVEPESLQYSDGAWYLTGFCRLRQESRSFRLSRIEALALEDEIFRPRRVFPAPEVPLTVRIRFQPGILRWVRERQHYAFQHEEPGDQGVVMTYRCNDFRELKPWVLSWGAAAEVLSPPGARQEIRAELQALLDSMK